MGSTHWSDDEYRDRARVRAATGKTAFEYDAAVRQLSDDERRVHPKMNPYGVKVRESRDSGNHPTSRAVAVLIDVTGSMQTVPRILQANLPKLMGLLIRKGYLEHPQILIGAVGDATCDQVPLQVGQFESGIEIEEDLGKLYMEGGGGGQVTESYELAMYFLARHTEIDCFEKRGQKGYLFIIGDEAPYRTIKQAEVERIIGDTLQADLSTEELLEELQLRYHVYFVIPKMTSHWNNEAVRSRWVKLLGQNVLKLEDPAGICELIASTVGLNEGRISLEELEGDLRQEGAETGVARAVSRALDAVGASANVAAPGASAGRTGRSS